MKKKCSKSHSKANPDEVVQISLVHEPALDCATFVLSETVNCVIKTILTDSSTIPGC